MSLKYVKWWQIYYSFSSYSKILSFLYAIHCTSLNECATHLLLRIFMTLLLDFIKSLSLNYNGEQRRLTFSHAALQITLYLTQTSGDVIIYTLSPTQCLTLALLDDFFYTNLHLVDFKKCLLSLKQHKMSDLKSHTEPEECQKQSKKKWRGRARSNLLF